ncbi:MAG: glutamate synthase central domain-containing protein, partial [Planctomycetota bacterium]
GPAALIFGDGTVIGARLDRLGLRPLRTVETDEYLAAMSEAGQIRFDPDSVIRRGRVEAGGMIYLDHSEKGENGHGRIYETEEALERLAEREDYPALLAAAQVHIDDLAEDAEHDPKKAAVRYPGDLTRPGRYVAYTHNQETFKFLIDPMLQTGVEKVSAMGYGSAINALSDQEGGIAKYFSQRFAQVTNPPLDSIRERDGMTLRVALGEKPTGGVSRSRQVVVDSPVLLMSDVLKIKAQAAQPDGAPVETFDALYEPVFDDDAANETALVEAIDRIADDVAAFAGERGGIAILTDRGVSRAQAAVPMTLLVSAVNQRMIEAGVRRQASLVVESGSIGSSHHIACCLGFGAAAVYPLAVRLRAEQLYGEEGATEAFYKFKKAAEKALLKTMGKVGLCTVESYSGGEFFEPNFLDTDDPVFKKYLPNMKTPVGGVQFATIAKSVADWHARAQITETDEQIPILGLFKERSEGAGHSYGAIAVRGFVDLTEEKIAFAADADDEHNAPDGEVDPFRLLTLRQMDEALGITEDGYVNTSFDKLTTEQIDGFQITPGYRAFSRMMAEERARRPAALRDVLEFPADVTFAKTAADFTAEMTKFNRAGNRHFVIRGIAVEPIGEAEAVEPRDGVLEHHIWGTADDRRQEFRITLLGLGGTAEPDVGRLDALAQSLVQRFNKERDDVSGHHIGGGTLTVKARGYALDYLSRIRTGAERIPVREVQPASQITPRLASGAMSHGALVATAHEAVAHGTNMAGALSNSGEGGESPTRYGTIR